MQYLYDLLDRPTRLYIKQCPHCGLKYFGKHTGQDIESYPGSGKIWTRHLKKHQVKPIHLWNSNWYYDASISRFALKFSRLNHIVENSTWANLKEEDGIDGGWSLVNKLRNTLEIPKNSWDNVNDMRRRGLIPPSINSVSSANKRNETLYSKDPNFYQNIGEKGNKVFLEKMKDEVYRTEYSNKLKNSFSSDHQRGSKNSQFGKKFKFVNDGVTNKKIEEKDVQTYLNMGYTPGRIKSTV